MSEPSEPENGEQELPSDLSFEQALSELEALVERLESGSQGLEQDLTDFQRGIALARYCERQLGEAEQVVYKLVEESDGERLEELTPHDDPDQREE